jgi:glycosyl transferase family 25
MDAMQVYVINLDRDRDRLTHMQRQLRTVPFTRVAAIDGTENPHATQRLTQFELACLASHRVAWRQFLAGPEPFACFLEDDIHISPGFATIVEDPSWIPADAHSVKLDTYLQPVKLGERRRISDGRQIARLYTRHESSAAYLLSRAGAGRYLDLTADPALPADYALFPKNARKLGLHIYQLVPAVAIQDHLRPAQEGGKVFATAMGGGAPTHRRGRLGKVLHEGARLVGQAAGLKEAIYLRAFLKPDTTTVEVG